jgi:hypothetical protein
MRVVYIGTQREEQAFAEKAAEHFANNPKHNSYSTGEITPGCLLALRWNDRAIAVLKLDDAHMPTIYGDMLLPAQEPS